MITFKSLITNKAFNLSSFVIFILLADWKSVKGMMVFIIFFFAALLAAFRLSAKTDRRWLSFLLIFWIFTQPILNTELLLEIPDPGFYLQPNRIQLFLLVPCLFIAGIREGDAIQRPPFEKFIYIYIYLGIVFIALAFNFDVIRKQSLAVVPLEILTFLVLYTAGKRYATTSFFESIINLNNAGVKTVSAAIKSAANT